MASPPTARPASRSANWIAVRKLLIDPDMSVDKVAAHFQRQHGKVSTRPIQNRRVMSTSSGLGPVSVPAISGSSAMPQIGQEPGPTFRISGCMGQV